MRIHSGYQSVGAPLLRQIRNLNTLNVRLNRIEKIIEKSLKDTDTLPGLLLACSSKTISIEKTEMARITAFNRFEFGSVFLGMDK
jgi:hypothetical protein